jgi:hypothetical protein
LSIELSVSEVKVKEIVMGLFPALDDEASDNKEENYNPFYYRRDVNFLSDLLSSIT